MVSEAIHEIEAKKLRLRDLRKSRLNYAKSDVDLLVEQLIGPQPIIESQKQQEISPPEAVRTISLAVQDFVVYDIAPTEVISYNKDVQTDVTDQTYIPIQTVPNALAEHKEISNNSCDIPEQKEEETVVPKENIRELSNIELQLTFESEPFLKFFEKASKVLQNLIIDCRSCIKFK
jgi:hypothetical protein